VPTFVVIMRGPSPLTAKPIVASEDPGIVAACLAAIRHELPPPADEPPVAKSPRRAAREVAR